MKILLTLLALLAIPLVSNAMELSSKGVGKIHLTQDIKEIQKALGEDFYEGRVLDEEEVLCHYVEPKTIKPPINLMIEKGKLTRIDIFSEKIASPEGLHIGDSEELIYKTFGKDIEKKDHPYMGKDGAYLIINLGESKLLFETFIGKIQSFRIGVGPAIYYIEGCQ